MLLRRWARRRCSPYAGAAARGVDDAPDAGPPAALEQIEAADDVHARVERGIGDGASHRRLRGEMRDRLRSLRREHVREPRAPEVHRVEPHRLARQPRRVAGGEVVHHRHLVPGAEEGVDDVRADEAGAARDEDPHRAVPARRYQSIVSRSPRSTSTFGSQSSRRRARVMSGWRTLGSSTGSGNEADLARRARQPHDQLRELEQRHLVRVADVDGVVHRRVHEPPDALDEIGVRS